MGYSKHPKRRGLIPAAAPWLVRAHAVVQLGTAIVTLIGAIVALLARLGLPWLR